jgi:hypothetical protein
VLSDEYVETVDAQGRAVEREREAIRILKPQGRQRASCGLAYDVDEKINYFHVWTIGADEKQYQAQDSDFVDEGDARRGRSQPLALGDSKTCLRSSCATFLRALIGMLLPRACPCNGAMPPSTEPTTSGAPSASG